MVSYATVLNSAKIPMTPDEAKCRAEAERLMALLDKDKDGRLTTKEFYDQFCVDKASRKKVMRHGQFQYNWYNILNEAQKAELQEEAMEVWAEDTKQYHDVDKDGVVSVEELAASFLQWSVVNSRLEGMRQSREMKNAKKWLDKT